MKLNEATKISILHHNVNFKNSKYDIATLWLENDIDSDIYVSIDDCKLRDNFIKSGVGSERWKAVISRELRAEVIGGNFKMLTDHYSTLNTIRVDTTCANEDRIVLDGDVLKEFMVSDNGKSLQKLMDNNYPDGMTDEERLEMKREILRPYLQANCWDVTHRTRGDILKHRNSWLVIADEVSRDSYRLGVRMPEQDYEKIFEKLSEYDFITIMTPVFADILVVGKSDIEYGDITKVIAPKISDEEEVSLHFPRAPYLATNTLGNYKVDNVELKRITDVVELSSLNPDDKDFMGVLLDFSDPKAALEMLTLASNQDICIYHLQPNGDKMEIVPIENKKERRSRRSRR